MMDDNSVRDLISDLPESIIEIIFANLPTRDVVKTSILSRKWRYRWSTMTELVFDDHCAPTIGPYAEKYLKKFITRFLFLHNGPIHKFSLSSLFLESCPNIDQWLLFLSRRDIKELILELGRGEWFRIPSSLFSCKKLSRLELLRCELDLPPDFIGFPCLKNLKLHQVVVPHGVIESLISGCPLLESLSLSYFDNLALTVCAPNLKFLHLEGEFKDIILENTPLLIAISLSVYMNDDIAEHLDKSSRCNFDKLLAAVPRLERLTGLIYFTKYLSIGNGGLGSISMSYERLKLIELNQVNFEDMKELRVILRLILSSPNLEELHMSSSSHTSVAAETPGFDFWERESPEGFTLNRLRIVKMDDVYGFPHEMGLIKFLLGKSPVLQMMTVSPYASVAHGIVNMLTELARFRRASNQAEVDFTREKLKL